MAQMVSWATVHSRNPNPGDLDRDSGALNFEKGHVELQAMTLGFETRIFELLSCQAMRTDRGFERLAEHG